MNNHRYFYRDLPTLDNFSEAIQTRLHVAIPDDWWIVIADVVGSTKAIEDGDYKKVNTIGVACIASVVNVDRDIDIPFSFGGDGATFAIPDNLVKGVISALRGSQKLARECFGLVLRAGLIKIGDLVKQGFPVNVAKVRLSSHITQSSFSGRGWDEAERWIKSVDALEVVKVHEDDGPAEANFEGFECRWQPVPSFNDHKLSLLVAAMSNDSVVSVQTYQAVTGKINTIYGDVADYHPLRPSQLNLTLNPKLLGYELQVRSGSSNLWKRLCYFIKMISMSLVGKYYFARNNDSKPSKLSHYRAELVENTDFRKFDGMLRMVIDGTESQAEKLKAYLDSQFQDGKLVYGMHKSQEALVTCLVQSYNGNHLHLVDGSDGGYAMAALGIKHQLSLIKLNR